MLNQKKIIHDIFKDYIIKEENVFLAERLFVANSIMNWACEHYKDPKQLNVYFEEVKRHLQGEITLYWSDGIVKIKREKRGKV